MADDAKTAMIADRIDHERASTMAISAMTGGMAFGSMVEVLEFSKMMAVGGVAIPPFLRGNPGACLAICIQAIEWRMSPYAVANKAYVANDRVGYESQLLHAIIEMRAPLEGRLRHKFSGEGGKLTCTVWGHVRGEDVPFEYTSPTFESIQPKNSPLWKTKPDLQLYYSASRDWARMYFPDVLLGVYSSDELADAIDVKATPVQRPRTLRDLIENRPPAVEAAGAGVDVAPPEPEFMEPRQAAWDRWLNDIADMATADDVRAMGIPASFTPAQRRKAQVIMEDIIIQLEGTKHGGK